MSQPHPHWTHFDHLTKFISCIPYFISNLGKSGVHSFKRCLIWSWNKEVMTVWRLCKQWAEMSHPHPISLLLDTFLKHFLELKLCILYLVSNIGKSGVQSFKRCLIWRWNEEVMAIWRWLCKVERKCCSRTPFRYCWTHFWSTSWSSNYAYHMSIRILGSQKSNTSNYTWFGVGTKKIWPFEDERAKLGGNFAAKPPFRRVFRSCETTLWHTSTTSQRRTPISQLRNGLRKSPPLQNPFPAAKTISKLQKWDAIFFFMFLFSPLASKWLQNDLQASKWMQNDFQTLK